MFGTKFVLIFTVFLYFILRDIECYPGLSLGIEGDSPAPPQSLKELDARVSLQGSSNPKENGNNILPLKHVGSVVTRTGEKVGKVGARLDNAVEGIQTGAILNMNNIKEQGPKNSQNIISSTKKLAGTDLKSKLASLDFGVLNLSNSTKIIKDKLTGKLSKLTNNIVLDPDVSTVTPELILALKQFIRGKKTAPDVSIQGSSGQIGHSHLAIDGSVSNNNNNKHAINRSEQASSSDLLENVSVNVKNGLKDTNLINKLATKVPKVIERIKLKVDKTLENTGQGIQTVDKDLSGKLSNVKDGVDTVGQGAVQQVKSSVIQPVDNTGKKAINLAIKTLPNLNQGTNVEVKPQANLGNEESLGVQLDQRQKANQILKEDSKSSINVGIGANGKYDQGTKQDIVSQNKFDLNGKNLGEKSSFLNVKHLDMNLDADFEQDTSQQVKSRLVKPSENIGNGFLDLNVGANSNQATNEEVKSQDNFKQGHKRKPSPKISIDADIASPLDDTEGAPFEGLFQQRKSMARKSGLINMKRTGLNGFDSSFSL